MGSAARRQWALKRHVPPNSASTACVSGVPQVPRGNPFAHRTGRIRASPRQPPVAPARACTPPQILEEHLQRILPYLAVPGRTQAQGPLHPSGEVGHLCLYDYAHTWVSAGLCHPRRPPISFLTRSPDRRLFLAQRSLRGYGAEEITAVPEPSRIVRHAISVPACAGFCTRSFNELLYKREIPAEMRKDLK